MRSCILDFFLVAFNLLSTVKPIGLIDQSVIWKTNKRRCSRRRLSHNLFTVKICLGLWLVAVLNVIQSDQYNAKVKADRHASIDTSDGCMRWSNTETDMKHCRIKWLVHWQQNKADYITAPEPRAHTLILITYSMPVDGASVGINTQQSKGTSIDSMPINK